MARSISALYGVYLLDRGEWTQISEHKHLDLAMERAQDAHAVLGLRVRIKSSAGIVMLELEARPTLPGLCLHSTSITDPTPRFFAGNGSFARNDD